MRDTSIARTAGFLYDSMQDIYPVYEEDKILKLQDSGSACVSICRSNKKQFSGVASNFATHREFYKNLALGGVGTFYENVVGKNNKKNDGSVVPPMTVPNKTRVD